jgi:hypothetical protein
VGAWLTATAVAPESMIPANLIGLFVSAVLMVVGSLAPQVIANRGHAVPHRH